MSDRPTDMDHRRAWRVLDYARDVFMHHRKFTPFQKFIFVSLLMGVLLALIRNWSCLMLVTNYGLSVYCAIKIAQILSHRNVFLPTDLLLQWVENIEGAMSAIFVHQNESKSSPVKAKHRHSFDKQHQTKFYIPENTHSNRKDDGVRLVKNSSQSSHFRKVGHDQLVVEREVQLLTKLIHKDFFISWYDLFTKDELVWSEAEIILIMIFDSLQGRLMKANIPHIVQSIMILYRTHVSNLKEAEFMFKAQSKRRKNSSKPRESSPGVTKLDIRPRKTLVECYETKTELHPALKSAEFELAYQKAIVDCLLLHLLPNELLEIKTLMTAVKEILSVNLLQNLLTSLSDPIFIYEKVIVITSDEEPLDCVENKSDVCVIENDPGNTANSVHPILVKRDSGSKIKTTEENENSKLKSDSVETDSKSETVTWKDDIQTYPVSKSFCAECNRLCSRDRDKIPSRPHTCSVGSEDEVQKYDRLTVKQTLGDQGHKTSDSDSHGSRNSPTFVLSLTDSESEVFKEDRLSIRNIPDMKTIPPDQRDQQNTDSFSLMTFRENRSNDDLSKLNNCSENHGQDAHANSVTPDSEKGIGNFNLPNIPSLFPKFSLNLPNPLSSISKPLSLGPLKLSPSDLSMDKDEQSLDVKKSQSSGSILRRDKSRSPVSPRDAAGLNNFAVTQTPAIFQDIRIINTESAREPGANSLYTLYEVEYEALYQSDTKTLVHKSGKVKRRFREFVNLQTRLEEISEYKKSMKDIKGPKKLLPSLPFGNMGRETLENRKSLLENFLQSLIKKDVLCNSEEMKQFLGYSGDGHIAFVRKASETSIPRIDQRLVKTMSGVFDKIVEGLPSLPQQIPKMIPSFESPEDKKEEPEQLEDKDHIDVEIDVDLDELVYESVVDKFMYERLSCKMDNGGSLNTSSNTSTDLGVSILSWQNHQLTTSGRSPSISPKRSHFSKRIGRGSPGSGSASPSSSLEDIVEKVQKESRTKHSEPPDHRDECPLSSAVLDILTELLRGQDNWMCRDSVMNSTKMVFGKGLNRYLQTKIQLLTSAEMNSFYLKKFREAFWPDDIFMTDQHPPYTDYQREVLKGQAHRCLGEFLPGILKVLLGTDDFEHILDEAIHSVKYEQLNRHVWYSVLDLLIEEIFPEINSQELQRKLSSAVEKS